MYSNLKAVVLVVLLGMGFTLAAQEDLQKAKQQLRQLKSGMILIRLNTKDINVKALESMGRKEQARELREKQYQRNKESILAFSEIFDFCPVYFFYAPVSDEIVNGNLKGNIFDADLKVIENVDSLPDTWFVGSFGKTPRLGIEGFVLMDQYLEPLSAPFPFYQRKHIFLGLVSLSRGQMAESYNAKLKKTYRNWFPGL